MSIFRRIQYSIIILFSCLLLVSAAEKECVLPNQRSATRPIIIPANPPLQKESGYSPTKVTQKAAWTDSGYYTDDAPNGFEFEISGGWTP